VTDPTVPSSRQAPKRPCRNCRSHAPGTRARPPRSDPGLHCCRTGWGRRLCSRHRRRHRAPAEL